MEKWIAYRHIDGHIKVRHFDREFGKELIEQLESSPFVDTYLYPYEAPNRKEAERLAKEKLDEG